ncbi:MAG: hypothetical protein IKJ43_04360 [Bacilli bacterium]|nr:hypothetical protein [Bacilli bacterium]
MINIKSTKLLFLYRTFLFKFTKFKTDKEELKNIVNALNKKNKKERYTYIYEETIEALNKYYKDDFCDFQNNQCIAQRKSGSKKINGCCRFCPIVTDKGCPSENISCKLIYCKTSIQNFKLLKLWNVKITKCLSPGRQLILRGNFFITKDEFIKDLYDGTFIFPFRTIKRELKRTLKK